MHGRYCHDCGKSQIRLPLTLSGLCRDAWERILQWESSLLRTIALLLWRPSRVLSAFFAGQRLHFTHPFTLLLISATLSLLASNSYGEIFWQEFRAQMIQYAGPAKSARYQTAFADFYLWLMSALPYWLLLFSLPIGAIVRVAFPRRRITIAEAWVVSLYANAIAILLDIVMTFLLRQFDVSMSIQMSATNALLLVFNVWYFSAWLGWQWWTLLRVVFMVIFAYLLVGILQSIAASLWAVSQSI